MNGYSFPFHGATLLALPSGALFWADQRLLVVSDLHLGKSDRIARSGGPLLPPYETRDTLARLDADIAAMRPSAVICLGDSFDDLDAAGALDEAESLWIARMMAGRRWIWVEGNHDPGPLALGGSHLAQVTIGGLSFRHIADPSERAEVSGHYHPKARLAGTSRACFLLDEHRLILPAFGTYTGGLRCTDPVLTALMRPGARAILLGQPPRAIPMPLS